MSQVNSNNDHTETSTENSLPPAFKNIADPDPPLVGQEQNGATENVLHGSDGTDNNGDTAAAQSVLESVKKFEWGINQSEARGFHVPLVSSQFQYLQDANTLSFLYCLEQ